MRFTERLDEIGARPSIGSVGDSFDALAETTNGLYKAECVYGPDAHGWDDVDELELAHQGQGGSIGLVDFRWIQCSARKSKHASSAWDLRRQLVEVESG